MARAKSSRESASTVDTRDQIASVLVADSSTIPFGCATGDRIRVQVFDLGIAGTSTQGLIDGFVHVWIED
jgi:hypothetical protein